MWPFGRIAIAPEPCAIVTRAMRFPESLCGGFRNSLRHVPTSVQTEIARVRHSLAPLKCFLGSSARCDWKSLIVAGSAATIRYAVSPAGFRVIASDCGQSLGRGSDHPDGQD